MNYKIPFYKPLLIKKINNLNASNLPQKIKDASLNLEKKLEKRLNSNILSIANSSLAIHLALSSINIKRGDKIICAINSYVDIPESIRHFDSEPIFVDIEPKSYHINLHSLKEIIKKNKTKKLKAIIVSQFSGLNQDINKIKEIVKENNLIVIEDFSDIPLKNIKNKINSDIAIFSLNYKFDNLLKGALISFKEQEYFKRAKLLREHGVIKSKKEIDYLYDIVDIGYDYKLNDLNAYLLEGLLEENKIYQNQKKKIVELYFKELEPLTNIYLPIKSNEHNYNYFIIEVHKNRDAFARELKKRGVEVGLHYIPLNFTTYYKKKYNLKVTSFPNALSIYQRILSLPCYEEMSLEEAKYVTQMVKEVSSNHI